MPNPRKPIYAWAIVTPRGRLDTDSIRPTRKSAIGAMCWGLPKVWVSYRAEGYRCVKVEVKEVPR